MRGARALAAAAARAQPARGRSPRPTGWWLSFDRLGARPRFRGLMSVRVIGDALMLGLPSGSVLSETVQPWLLKRRCGVPTEHGIVATVARKFFVVLSHGLFLALATLMAWPLLERASRATIGRVGLPILLLLDVAGAGGGGAAAAHRDGARAGGRPLAARARPLRRPLDGLVARAQRAALPAHRRRARPLLPPPLGAVALGRCSTCSAGSSARSRRCCSCGCVGVDAPLSAAMVIETALILVRALAVPVPAGLGVQDLGYVLSLKALGVARPDHASGAAFVLLKRGKDAVLGRRRLPAAEPRPAPGGAAHRAHRLERPLACLGPGASCFTACDATRHATRPRRPHLRRAALRVRDARRRSSSSTRRT